MPTPRRVPRPAPRRSPAPTPAPQEEMPPDPWGDAAHTEVWERQPGEGPKAYEGFAMYRDLGGPRTIKVAAERCGKASGTFRRLAYEHAWVARANAWDREQEKAFVKEMAGARVASARAHLAISNAMLNKAVERLRSLQADKMSPRDVALFVDTAVKVQRLLVGETTENVGRGADTHVADFERLTEAEQIARLTEVQREIESRGGIAASGIMPPPAP